jgi:hypothetical protein
LAPKRFFLRKAQNGRFSHIEKLRTQGRLASLLMMLICHVAH